MPYSIQFAPDAVEHFRDLRKYDQVRIRDAVLAQLTHEPDVETRHRKRLQSPLFGVYELRVGDFRVFYDVDAESTSVVVQAVGIKKHARLFVGGEEISEKEGEP